MQVLFLLFGIVPFTFLFKKGMIPDLRRRNDEFACTMKPQFCSYIITSGKTLLKILDKLKGYNFIASSYLPRFLKFLQHSIPHHSTIIRFFLRSRLVSISKIENSPKITDRSTNRNKNGFYMVSACSNRPLTVCGPQEA